MEFSSEDVAKLVLGYLKEQKCRSAFSEFLNNSKYLKQHALRINRGKYFITRVGGLSLSDYLREYSIINTIVQERLEATDFYNERDSRASLVQQLLYLLGGGPVLESRTSTPVNDTTLCPERDTAKSKSTVQPQDSFAVINNSSFERISAGIDATPICSLPGNSNANFSFLNNSKNRSTNSSSKIDKSTNTDDELDMREKSQECEEIFTQTFLENSDLIKKLADNINKEVSAKSVSSDNPSDFSIGQELDEAAIETIIMRTATDPVIVNLLEEIIGSPNKYENLASAEKTEGNLSAERVIHSTPNKILSDVSDCIKKRLRSSKRNLEPLESSPSIEEQNNEAVQCIVAASLSGEKQPIEKESDATTSSTQSMSMGEIIFNGPHDNFVHTEILAGPSTQNTMYVNSSNSGGLLMLQPSVTAACSTLLQPKAMQVDPVKPYYVISNQPFINMNIPPTPLKLNSVLTEQDIMTMPTIIVCDNNQQSTSTQTVIMPTTALSCSANQTTVRTIAPKKMPEKAESLSEYITLYKCNEAFSPVLSRPQLESLPPNPRTKPKASTSSTSTRTKKKSEKKLQQTSNTKVQTEKSTNESSTIKLRSETAVSEAEPDYTQTNTTKESLPQILTPQMKIQGITESRSRSTPRNGSHVRQLDFSTPDKWCNVLRRANTSPKIDKSGECKDTPVKAPKASTSKSIRTSLFKSPDLEVPVVELDKPSNDEPDNTAGTIGIMNSGADTTSKLIETSEIIMQSSKNPKSSASWDSDLRALAGNVKAAESDKIVAQKQKRKHSEDLTKEHNTSKKFKETLNKTEDDALKIEMALTGIENDIDNISTITESSVEDKKKNSKASNKRRDRITIKKAVSVNKPPKNEKQTPGEISQVIPSAPVDNCVPADSKLFEEVSVNADIQKKGEDVQEKQYVVINRHMKPRIKKKCNMENSIKKTPVTEELILTNITKIKSCEILDEGKNKLILSPSKLNANKRSLVDVESRITKTGEVAKIVSGDLENQEATILKFVSPETMRLSTSILPGSAKRAIMPVLETPVKYDSAVVPKTPGFFSAPIIDTPFTKAVIDQLTGVDINEIQTPKFPITPNFPFTPTNRIEQSPFSNRPTDYSTSSSYYQPSDTEQNKSIEQLLEECHRLETQPSEEISKVEDKVDEDTITSSVSPSKTLQKPQNNPDEIKKAEMSKPSGSPQLQVPEVVSKTVSDKLKEFNSSMIGKKNLHLLKKLSNSEEKDSSSGSSDSSSESDTSSSSSDESDSSDSSDSSSSQSIKKSSPTKNVTPYSLRPRKSVSYNTSSDISRELQFSPKVSGDADKIKAKPTTFQDGLLQEMEKKRLRTIAKFKTTSTNSKAKERNTKLKEINEKRKQALKTKKVVSKAVKPPLKKLEAQTKSKLLNSNTCENSFTIDQLKKQQQKLDSSKTLPQPESQPYKHQKPSPKINTAKIAYVATKEANATDDDEDQIMLHLSSDDETLEPFEMVETELLECSTSLKSVIEVNTVCSDSNLKLKEPQKMTADELENQETVDQQAESLVNGLKEWGIHLIPNKPTRRSVISVKSTEQCNVQPKENPVATKIIDQQPETMPKQPQIDSVKKCEVVKENPEKLEKLRESKEKTDVIKKRRPSNETTCNLEKLTMPKDKPQKQLKHRPSLKETIENLGKQRISKEKNQNLSKEKIVLSRADPKKFDVVKQKDEKPRVSKEKIENHEKPGVSKEKHEKPSVSIEKNEKSGVLKEKIEKDKIPVVSKEKSENQEKHSTIKEIIEKREKPSTLKEKVEDNVNISIEEGEIITDNEISPLKLHVPGKIRAEKVERIYSKSTSESCRTVHGMKETKGHHDRRKNSKESYRNRSYLEGKFKGSLAGTSKKFATSKVSKSETRKLKTDNKAVKEVKPKKKTVMVPPIPEPEYQEQFDIRTYPEETYRFTHDYSNESNRSINDYNLEILTKTYSADIYINEIRSVIKKVMTFTPLEFVLNILPKPSTTSVNQKSNKPSTSGTETKKKPLTILYNQLIKSSVDTPRSSPLEHLYSPEPSSRDHRRNSDVGFDKVKETQKSDKLSQSKSKTSVKEKATVKEKCTDTNLEQESEVLQQRHEEKQEDLKSTENLINQDSLSMRPLKTQEQQDEDLAHNLAVVDGVIMLNSTNNCADDQTKVEDASETNDDLMNYALVGSERVPNEEEFVVTDTRKRKPSEGEGEKLNDKKQKTEGCQELLRNIDVDSFLKKLHGET